jgi:hypothetical protein
MLLLSTVLVGEIGGATAPAGSWTFNVTHPSTWTGDIVGDVYPGYNATEEWRDYEYRATPAQPKWK